MVDAWTYEIERLTLGIRALRIVRQLINRRGGDMARLLEIKGLGADIAGIRSEIAGIKSVARDINTEAPLLRAEMTDVRDQLREHRADLRSEAESLGNGNGEQSEKPPASHGKIVEDEKTGEATGTVISSEAFPATEGQQG